MSSAPDSVSVPDDDARDDDARDEDARDAGPEQRPRPKPAAALIFDDPFDRPSSDDTDEAWGDRPPAQSSAADLSRFLDEKPPHHI